MYFHFQLTCVFKKIIYLKTNIPSYDTCSKEIQGVKWEFVDISIVIIKLISYTCI